MGDYGEAVYFLLEGKERGSIAYFVGLSSPPWY